MLETLNKSAITLKFKCKLLFYLIILLVSCSVLGQGNKFINAHFDGDRVYLEIKNELLNTPVLFVRHDVGYHQVIWSKQNDHLLLTIPQIQSTSGALIPVHYDYKNDSNIIGKFPIIKEKSNSTTFHIEVTNLFFNSEIKWNIQILDTAILDKSFIKGVHFLKNETIITTVQTTQRGDIRKSKEVNYSFYKLPNLMTPRLFDHRMGFTIEDEYDIINGFAVSAKANIMRWRLEKNSSTNTLSKPLEPIVFYFDPEMPSKYKKYVKAGVLEWLPAFEAAGFKNAIEVRDLPNVDSLWIRNSINYSVIRWRNNSNIRGGEFGGGGTVDKIVDLRSGEILKGDIILSWSDANFSDRYLIRCAPMDKRAQQYPFPDELIGQLLQSLTAHEAGHAFGIKDSNFGEYAYPFDKMRDKKWLKKMGHTPSIMTYARQNYIVQPEDNIPPNLLIQKVGPADHYQIKWGYKIFSKNEISNLENLILEQNSIPWLRYTGEYGQTIGPGTTNEVVESNDPIQSTRLGIKNIKRVLELLPQINLSQKDNSLLSRLHSKTLELWYQQMSQVMSLIGGYSVQYKSGSQSGPVYTPIPQDIQMEALDFLLENAFEVPEWLSNPAYLNKIQYSTDSDILLNYQLKLLSELVEPFRMKRLENMEKSASYNRIIQELLSKLTHELFIELQSDNINLKSRRQELQTAYINILNASLGQNRDYVYIGMNKTSGLFNGYLKGVYAEQLMTINDKLNDNINKVKEGNILGHFKICIRNSNLIN